MSLLPLTVACWNYDRTLPLYDGRVTIEGCDMRYFDLEPEEMFHRALHHQEFDVTELSFSNYTSMRARGDCPYIAIPVFPGRKFRHSAIYIRTDRGIKTPADLKGKKIGAPEYQVSAVAWVRGMLKDEYGVLPTDFTWHSGGLEQAGRTEKVTFTPPKGVSLTAIPAGRTLSDMLEKGEIDALIAPRAPSCFLRKAPNVGRLFPDFVAAEKDYYKRTGIYPIMHVIGILETKLRDNPWLAASVYKAFDKAKDMALDDMRNVTIPKITHPWSDALAAEMEALFGRDFWPYGIDANRVTIEAFLRYHHEQGLSVKHLSIEEAFAASTMEQSRI